MHSSRIITSGNRVLNFTSWASIAHLIAAKGGNYLLALSIGGVLTMFLPFIAEALCQAQTTLVSRYLGAKQYSQVVQLFYSGSFLALIPIGLMTIPLIFFPGITFQSLFSEIILDSSTIRLIFLGVWISFACYTFAFIPISYVLAYKDTKFSLFMGVVGWINGYLLIYFAFEGLKAPPEYFWLILSLMHGSSALLYYLRMRKLLSRTKAMFSYQ